eukprot:4612860-Pleurochrysis_carterae.AAC.3
MLDTLGPCIVKRSLITVQEGETDHFQQASSSERIDNTQILCTDYYSKQKAGESSITGRAQRVIYKAKGPARRTRAGGGCNRADEKGKKGVEQSWQGVVPALSERRLRMSQSGGASLCTTYRPVDTHSCYRGGGVPYASAAAGSPSIGGPQQDAVRLAVAAKI